jgi:homoserine kinase type II
MSPDPRPVLARYPASVQPLSGPEPIGNAGGASGARLWRLRSGGGTLVLRAWPDCGPGRETLGQIHAWLGEASVLGFVPAPIRGLDGRTLQEVGGRLWELAPWMPGSPDPGRPPAPGRVRAGFAGLASLHQAWAHRRSVGPSPGLADRVREMELLLRSGFAELDAATTRPGGGPEVDLARRWLALARSSAPRVLDHARRAAGRRVPLQPCVRDVRPDHLLFEGDRLTGLVDFGAMAIDTVAADLARLMAEWLGDDRVRRAEALSAYEAIRPLDAGETSSIPVFEKTAALLGGGHWARWHFLEGRTFDDSEAVVHGLRHGLDRVIGLAASPDLG